ncbi:MAG: sugar ABC transporter substrate-binding protein [Prolixibacteraceae bacterium]
MGGIGKQIKLILITFFSIVIFCSCQKNSVLKFGIMMPDLSKMYFIDSKSHFERIITEMGGIVLSADANNNEQLQIKQATDLIEKGVSVIVITAVNANTAAAIVRNAHEKGVKVVAYDRMIHNCNLDYYVSFNNEKVGELMASYAIEKKPRGNYILFYGDSEDMNAHSVRKGQFRILKPYIDSGAIDVMYQAFIDDWSGSNAFHKMNKILDYSDKIPDVLLSSYDGMSTSCIKAFENAGLDKNILVTGQNGEKEAYRNIILGKQAMTVYKPTEELAEEVARIAWKLAVNSEREHISTTISNSRIDVPSLLLDPILIDSKNLKNEIIDKGIFSKEELNL